jgi:3-hydroxy-9,10-secoandrosta-1,3,5(10)-triene-9,17-dione monooxygenase reductase component
MAVDPVEFRRALGSFASAVTVVTTKTAAGELAGITVTAFSSVSLLPPLIMVCIDKRARLHDELVVGRPFAVNMLAENQEEHSRRFASRNADPFAGLEYTLSPGGVPLFTGAVATIQCLVVECAPGGDHTIVVAEVEHSATSDARPLLYFRSAYGRLA